MAKPMDVHESAWDTATLPYVGRWNRLVSTTNWEKGRIIAEWRQALVDAGAAPSEYSSEAWSRRVGHVSPQHVGRLRRVFERFDAVRETYEGLYWSHFCAALDWDDAEMWLEGAVQSNWSVAQMRQTRWEALGSPADDEPLDDDVVASEWDEDAANDAFENAASLEPTVDVVRDPGDLDADEPLDDRGEPQRADELEDESLPAPTATAEAPAAAGVALVDVDRWPDDLAEAYERFKLAILRHKLNGWTEISPSEVSHALDGLKQLVFSAANE